MEIKEKKLKLGDSDLLYLFSCDDAFLNLIESKFNTVIILRGNDVILRGDAEEIKIIETVFAEINYTLKRTGTFKIADLVNIIDLMQSSSNNKSNKLDDNISNNNLIYYGSKDSIKAKNKKQTEYINKVNSNDLVFAVGPAGTGKTYLAVVMAIAAMKNNDATKIIITRPAVEAGESLGFLPGDLKEKIDPYLKPITDALYEMLGAEKCKSLIEKNVIEIIPLAYMRGRTLNNSFIILDEAQNATITQMKMFLTRLGINSKAIITGDITQIDLPNKSNSGLVNAKNILQNIKGIAFVYFDKKDIVRHHLVAQIINAYERDEENKQSIDFN